MILIWSALGLAVLNIVPGYAEKPDISTFLENVMPKECSKNGKSYKEGEQFKVGNLRYQCQKYGVYTIEGCISTAGTPVKKDETKVKGNLKIQCLTVGDTIFFKETECGTPNSVPCDQVPKPKGYEDALKKYNARPKLHTKDSGADAPAGWRVVNQGQQKLKGSNSTAILRTLVFDGIQRVKRNSDDDWKTKPLGVGIGSVIGMEPVGTDKPPMPLDLFEKLVRQNDAKHKSQQNGHVAHAENSLNSHKNMDSSPSLHNHQTSTGDSMGKSSGFTIRRFSDKNPKTGGIRSHMAAIQMISASTHFRPSPSEQNEISNRGKTQHLPVSPTSTSGQSSKKTVVNINVVTNSRKLTEKNIKVNGNVLPVDTGKSIVEHEPSEKINTNEASSYSKKL